MQKNFSRPTPCNPYDPEIAPNYTASAWRALDLQSPTNPDWQTAVDILDARLCARFFGPVAAIQDHPNRDVAAFSGFAILAIDCLLIETLGQFLLGYEYTPPKKSQEVYERVLLHGHHFHLAFSSPDIVRVFRIHFRNGILHQAETKARSCVRFDEPQMISQVDPNDPEVGLIVDRIKFHDALSREFGDYRDQLRKPTDSKLRRNFVKKMKFIAGK